MHPLLEELLLGLLGTGEALMRPTYYNWSQQVTRDESFQHFRRRIEALESRKLVKTAATPALDRVVRLTAAGRLVALGGRDPDLEWSRPWDGLWRLVLFDLPSHETRLRRRLNRFLRARHYGHLQLSGWLSPDPTTEVRLQLRDLNAAPGVLICLEGRPASGELDRDLVASGWDMDRVNQRYRTYLEHLDKLPAAAPPVAEWLARERACWREACTLDPMLPAALHPPGYLGTEAWRRRKALLGRRQTF